MIRYNHLSLLRVVLPVLLALMGGMLLWSPAGAAPLTQSSSPQCQQIEIVFLVDQSGSMGGDRAGSTDHPVPNDPLSLRFYGPVFSMRWLGNEYLVSRGIPGRPQVTFNVAVVNFGDSPLVALDWTALTPKDRTSWKDMEKALEQKLAPGPLATSNLGNTNFYEAFRQVADLFDQRGPQQAGCPRRVVVLLTDGEPWTSADGFTVDGHMRSVSDLVKTRMSPPDYRFFVTGINDPARPGAWTHMAPLWESLAQDKANLTPRQVELTTNPDQIAERLNRILLDLEQEGTPPPPPPPYGKPFAVPCYQQEVDVVFFKRNQNEHLSVRDEIGPVVPSRTDEEVELIGYDEPIETLRIRHPLPGKWVLETTANRADAMINFFKIPTAADFRPPGGGVVPLQYTHTKVEFQLVDSDQKPLPEYTDPTCQIQITATISSGGRQWPISLRRGSQHTFTADFVPVEVGKHSVTVQGMAYDKDGKLSDVINGTIGDFVVARSTMKLLAAPDSPANGCPGPQQALALSVSYGLRGPDDQIVLTDIPIRWDGSLSAPDYTDSFALKGPGASGVYSATLAPKSKGPHQMHLAAMLLEPIGGKEQKILDTGFSFDVAPTEPLTATLVSPQPGASASVGRSLHLQWMPPFIRLEPESLPVEVSFSRVSDGKAADPTAVTSAAAEQLLLLEVRNATNGQPVSGMPMLRPTGKPGQFRTELTGLDTGKFILTVRPNPAVALQCGFAWAISEPLNAEIDRISDPRLKIIYVVLGLIAAVVLFLLGRWFASTRHACSGWLVILDAQGERIAGGMLQIEGRNHRVFRNMPQEVGARRIEVKSRKGWEKEHRIEVQLWPLDGPPWDPFEMTPGKQPITNSYVLRYVLSLTEL